MTSNFSFFLFSTDVAFIRKAIASGVSGVVVDWEWAGKTNRQAGADTQINHDTLEDLRRVRSGTHALVICRVNGFENRRSEEIESAIDAGADEILLPMVRTVGEVEKVLSLVKGRCGLGVLVETIAAITRVEEFSRLPLCRVYVGLNDLAIERTSPHIFMPIVDGILENIRHPFQIPFGFGGLTLPERGEPIPCRLLMAEMVRLNCNFSFLRRSFLRDTVGRDPDVEVPRMHRAIADMQSRSPAVVDRDHADLSSIIRSISERGNVPNKKVGGLNELKRQGNSRYRSSRIYWY